MKTPKVRSKFPKATVLKIKQMEEIVVNQIGGVKQNLKRIDLTCEKVERKTIELPLWDKPCYVRMD